MAKWIVAEKTKAGLRHAVVCPKVTERTKKRIADIRGFDSIILENSHFHSLYTSRATTHTCLYAK